MREGWEDVTYRIERMEMMEDRMMLRLSEIQAYFCANEHRILLVGKVSADSGFKFDTDRQFIVCVAAYDDIDRVVASNFAVWRCSEFAGIDKFALEISVPADALSKIRVYPRWA